MKRNNNYSESIHYIVILAICFNLLDGCGYNQHSSTNNTVLSLLAQLEKVKYSSKNPANRKIFSNTLDKIASYGDSATPILIEEFHKAKNPNRRLAIILSLVKIGGKEAEGILINNITDSDVRIRASLATGLGEFDSDKSIKALSYMAIYDNNPTVRQLAILSLGRLGNEKALEVVKTMLNDKNPIIREAAQTALERINENKTK